MENRGRKKGLSSKRAARIKWLQANEHDYTKYHEKYSLSERSYKEDIRYIKKQLKMANSATNEATTKRNTQEANKQRIEQGSEEISQQSRGQKKATLQDDFLLDADNFLSAISQDTRHEANENTNEIVEYIAEESDSDLEADEEFADEIDEINEEQDDEAYQEYEEEDILVDDEATDKDSFQWMEDLIQEIAPELAMEGFKSINNRSWPIAYQKLELSDTDMLVMLYDELPPDIKAIIKPEQLARSKAKIKAFRHYQTVVVPLKKREEEIILRFVEEFFSWIEIHKKLSGGKGAIAALLAYSMPRIIPLLPAIGGNIWSKIVALWKNRKRKNKNGK